MDGYTCYRFIFSTNGIKIFNDFLSSLYGSKDLTSLKSGDKKFLSAILLLKNYLITGQVIPRKVPVELKGEIGSLMMQYILSRSQERLSGHTIYNHKQIFHTVLFQNKLS